MLLRAAGVWACDSNVMAQPSTTVSRLPEKQSTSRSQLEDLLDSTPLATIAVIRDGHPAIFPIGFVRMGDELVIHGWKSVV